LREARVKVVRRTIAAAPPATASAHHGAPALTHQATKHRASPMLPRNMVIRPPQRAASRTIAPHPSNRVALYTRLTTTIRIGRSQ